LDKDFNYKAGPAVAERRGFKKNPGGGLTARPEYSEPVSLKDILNSNLWFGISSGDTYDMQTGLFQPVGGMGRVGEAFGRLLGDVIRYNAKVINIEQSDRGVEVTYVDTASSATPPTCRRCGRASRSR